MRISLWLTFQVIGACALGLGATWLSHRRHGDWKVQPDVAVWVLLAMLAGARLAFVLENDRPLAEALNLFTAGYVAVGGIPAVALVLFLYARFRGIGFIRLLDSLAPFAALNEMFGHIACFMGGCCFGLVTTQPWGFTFPHDSLPHHFHVYQGWLGLDAMASLPIHPVQLYNAAISLCVYALLLFVALRNPRPGTLTLSFLFAHGLQRFIIQFFRGNHEPFIMGLRLPQFTALLMCIVVALVAAALFIRNRRQARLAAQS